ncbi:MAG TPA: hypothetical protein VJX69_17065 [Terriglobales bacterium]|nr:hypothetical protein [Terriglobales bacterium]
MTRIKFLFAALAVAAIAAFVPAAHAQEQACLGISGCNVHVVGAGSSAQFLTAGLGADGLALGIAGVGAPNYASNATNPLNCNTAGKANAVYHWSLKNGANVVDNRDSRILPELGNIWIVWIASCSDATGATGITDVWTDVSVDSTVGNRVFFAAETAGNGAQVQVIGSGAGGNLIGSAALWQDNSVDDTTLPAAVAGAIGTASTGGVHVNVGLTDIRPEDAYVATARALGKLNTTTWAGLGYIGVSANIGEPILTAQGTNTQATPVKFELANGTDPITHLTVRPATTVPIGAAPIVFIFNNNSAASVPLDLKTGVAPDSHVTGQVYPLANLFDGTTSCSLANPAFDSFSGAPQSTNITVTLREPLSGTMNTTEFNLFRSDGNTDDSQEKGIVNPYSKPYNPLNLACASGGNRWRAIGTGEVVNAVLNNANTLGYIFWGFSNAAKFGGSAKYNYLTLDGVDPLNYPTAGNQQLPNCPVAPATNCPSSNFTGGVSFASLRYGTYKAWSLYRWVVEDANDGGDIYGPAHLAAATEAAVDTAVADYVPFCTTGDSLSVYRSHFKDTVLPAEAAGNNGAASCSSTLGGDTEAGGDVGGLVEGPFDITVPTTNGYATWATTLTTGKGYKVTWKQGTHFTAGASWEGSTLTIGGTSQTIASVALTTTTLYVGNPNPNTPATAEVSFSAPFSSTFGAVSAPGILNKKQ